MMEGKPWTIDDSAAELLVRLNSLGYENISFLFNEIDDSETAHSDFLVVKNALYREGLITPHGSQQDTFSVTEKGRMVLTNGGYKEYIEDRRLEEKEEKKHKKSIRNRDYWQSKMAPWQVYLFWPIFILALLGAVGNAETAWNTYQKFFGTKPEQTEQKVELKSSTHIIPTDTIKEKGAPQP